MKLAVNYSNPLIRLLENHQVEVDLIKCPDWVGMLAEAAAYKPITIHYDLEVGLGNTFHCDFARISRLKDQTFTPHINTHLVTSGNFNPNDPEALQKINLLWREELGLMVNHFGANDVALEHYPYTRSTPHIYPAVESNTFSQVIEDTDCRLLLDLAHARITADTLRIDVKDYIRALPLARLVELHVTGIKAYAGEYTDHFALTVEDWDLLAWALQEINAGAYQKPRVVAFEYGGVGEVFAWRTDAAVLSSQIPILYEMVHGNN